MINRSVIREAALATVLALSGTAAFAQGAGPNDMTFFVTSAGSGKGADLGGLEGADLHCQTLAQAAGNSGKTWRAYLSVSAVGTQKAVNARERIGQGPWKNAKGVEVASNTTALHDNPNITKQTALTEKGDTVNGRGDQPNMHDILTGSRPDGTAFAGDQDMTCGNWTKSGADGAVMVGHHDRMG